MATGSCTKPDCTVKATGICLLSHPEPGQCPNFRSATEPELAVPSVAPASPADEPAKVEPEKKPSRTFHTGSELGALDAAELSRARYTHLIGVLGCHEAGKTCFLSSLYLLASGSKLPAPFLFKGCETLQAFEDRARGLREWKDGKLKEQLVDHTVLADTRQPSLLHLGIREADGERRSFDLLLTDLPGEWTDKLVTRASFADSFRFLNRADGIILVVDGALLLSATRHAELQRLRHFVDRLVNDVKVDTTIPFVILVSKGDEIDMQLPPAAEQLRNHVAALGFPVTAQLASAFSRTPEKVRSGTGVFEAIQIIVSHPAPSAYPSPSIEELGSDGRSWLRFRG